MRRVLWWCVLCCACACARARGRDAALRALPAVTNSLVNLGRMDIAFYINTKPQDSEAEAVRSRGAAAACPCGERRPAPRPTDLLAGLLADNDLFSFRDPAMSPLCCDSHEQVREDSIVFEFGPKRSQVFASPVHSNHFPAPAAPATSLAQLAGKHKFEHLIFPIKKEITLDLGKILKKHNANKDIKVVGDKEIRNDFKSMKLSPALSSSVKKDLAVQQKTTAAAPRDPRAGSDASHANVV